MIFSWARARGIRRRRSPFYDPASGITFRLRRTFYRLLSSRRREYTIVFRNGKTPISFSGGGGESIPSPRSIDRAPYTRVYSPLTRCYNRETRTPASVIRRFRDGIEKPNSVRTFTLFRDIGRPVFTYCTRRLELNRFVGVNVSFSNKRPPPHARLLLYTLS